MSPETRAYVAGRFLPAQDRSFEATSPIDGTTIAWISAVGPEHVNAAVDAARRAFVDGRWSRIPAARRFSILLDLADLVDRDADMLALLETLDVGKPLAQSRLEVALAATLLRRSVADMERLEQGAPFTGASALAMCVGEPAGVVALITPWNFPLVTACMKLAPALATGNSVILKPSEMSSLSALHLARLLDEAGVPEGVVSVLPGMGAVLGAALAAHPDIDLLSFTGSTATGQSIMAAAGRSNLKKLVLECGGKCATLVFPDADIERAALDIAAQACANMGQLCVATSRVVVHEAVHDALVEKLAEAFSALRIGDPLDPNVTHGPLASASHKVKVLQAIARAEAEGAVRVPIPGKPPEHGCFVAPALLTGVLPAHRVAQEEVFGPVISVLRASRAEEMEQVAGATDYGLAARIWTGAVDRGYALARRLRCGAVAINPGFRDGDIAPLMLPAEPFGRSGFGPEGGMLGLRQYLRTKTITIGIPE